MVGWLAVDFQYKIEWIARLHLNCVKKIRALDITCVSRHSAQELFKDIILTVQETVSISFNFSRLFKHFYLNLSIFASILNRFIGYSHLVVYMMQSRFSVSGNQWNQWSKYLHWSFFPSIDYLRENTTHYLIIWCFFLNFSKIICRQSFGKSLFPVMVKPCQWFDNSCCYVRYWINWHANTLDFRQFQQRDLYLEWKYPKETCLNDIS